MISFEQKSEQLSLMDIPNNYILEEKLGNCILNGEPPHVMREF